MCGKTAVAGVKNLKHDLALIVVTINFNIINSQDM